MYASIHTFTLLTNDPITFQSIYASIHNFTLLTNDPITFQAIYASIHTFTLLTNDPITFQSIYASIHEIPPMKVDGSVVEDHQTIANIFNTYFTTVNDKMGTNKLVNINVSSDEVYPLNYLYQVFTSQFPSIKLTPVTSKEI